MIFSWHHALKSLKVYNFIYCVWLLIWDPFLGLLPLEVKLVLCQFIFINQYFSLEYLNGVIQDFELGFMERNDRPSKIDGYSFRDVSEKKLGQSDNGAYIFWHTTDIDLQYIIACSYNAAACQQHSHA